MLLLFVWRVMTYMPLRVQMAGVLSRPINLAAVYILVVYLIVGALDSIHFEIQDNALQSKYQQSIVSVLDRMIPSALTHHEETYSAPFATKSFSKENIVTESGQVINDYAKLKFSGTHLSDTMTVREDIQRRTIHYSLQAFVFLAVLVVVISGMVARKYRISVEDFFAQVIMGRRKFPYRTFFALLFVTIFLSIFIYNIIPLYHILGTSKVGEDVLYQSLKSVRTGLMIGTLTTLIMLPFATILGIMAGYFRGWVDDIIQYTYTTLSSIPGVLLIAAAVLTLQVMMTQNESWFQTMAERSDARLLALCAILGVTSWTGLCRLLRGEALKLREIEYVQAARSLGTRHTGIIFKHILPNVMHLILIAVVLDFSGLVLAEAVLSYVGVGVDPTTYSWGTMINGARLEMARTPVVWWSLFSAFIFMFVLVLAANIFSDALRDVFDPRTQTTGAS
tara:strand:- start:25171 stop:26520 length:1350 start_codon:yes stop_codon:yes gene_type:complete